MFLKRDLLMMEKKVDAILYSDIGKLIGKYYSRVCIPATPSRGGMIFGDRGRGKKKRKSKFFRPFSYLFSSYPKICLRYVFV